MKVLGKGSGTTVEFSRDDYFGENSQTRADKVAIPAILSGFADYQQRNHGGDSSLHEEVSSIANPPAAGDAVMIAAMVAGAKNWGARQ